MHRYDVVIIGAGLSGIIAAQKLKQSNYRVLLLEKGPRVGGRLATKKYSKGKADYGAQFFTVRSDELNQEVQGWLAKGWVKQWFGENYPRYTSIDGMQEFSRRLAVNLPLFLSRNVSYINDQGSHFLLGDEEGKVYESERVICTMPAPQTLSLLANSSLCIEQSAQGALRMLTYEPTYVGLFQFDRPIVFPKNGHMNKKLLSGVERIVDHQKKGISSEVIVSVYMTADWSVNHDGEKDILELMREKTASYLDFHALVSQQLETWRYAQSADTHPHPFLQLDKEARIFAAGDAFLRADDQTGRTRFESAFLSGYDIASHLRN
ncbi:FAD-dependent oxidoreductase [Halobacillus shinanisalinarum]|uniref:FAD-dependent oxidoreductase n=1 Tax=Halobacillus shinanisalinarum TaxID=2932258 RepID=A0ABY4H530_9BACI|nr:FAD-dependent oxidoreductase [Halobacillus shinanisalinarum]UOQ95205.1 FAD-dependent oxidoreductase [Halobacillus shinanisalinarum]